MDIVKKNIVSIVCGVIALLALIALVWPIGPMYESFRAELKEREKANAAVQALLRAERTRPNLLGEDKHEPLGTFPSPAIIAQGHEVIGKLHENAVNLLQTAISINKRGHDLLVPTALPRPDAKALYAFRGQYQNVLSPGAPATAARPGSPAENIPDGILHSTAPPTAKEIKDALDKEWREKWETKVIKIETPSKVPGQPPVVQELDRPRVVAEFRAAHKDFEKHFREERATRFLTYMNGDALTVAQHMEPTVTPTAEDIWYAQMGLWIQQDIARQIAAMNTEAKSTSVATSPVKHVIGIDIPQGFAMYVTGAQAAPGQMPPPGAGNGGGGSGSAASSDVVNYRNSVSGRQCNQMYDVIDSRITLVVDEQYVDQLIRMLEKGQFITVLNVDLQKVDIAAAKDLGYDYGNRPVMQVTLDCEHLFLRDWTAQGPTAPMPDEVKQRLGVVPNASPDQAAPARSPVASR